jgi:hypothetical protein
MERYKLISYKFRILHIIVGKALTAIGCFVNDYRLTKTMGIDKNFYG